MEAGAILISISAIAIALAGFAAIFRAFRSRVDADGHSNLRLIGIVESGVAISLFCYLPLIIQLFDVPETTAFRIIGLTGAIFYLRLNFFLFMARKVEHSTPRIYLASCLSAILVVIFFMASALNLSEQSVGFYLLAILAMFLGQGLAFIGQFWAESV